MKQIENLNQSLSDQKDETTKYKVKKDQFKENLKTQEEECCTLKAMVASLEKQNADSQ